MNHILLFEAFLVFRKKYNHIKQRKWKFFCKVISDENEVCFFIKTCQILEKSSSSISQTFSMWSENLYQKSNGLDIKPEFQSALILHKYWQLA